MIQSPYSQPNLLTVKVSSSWEFLGPITQARNTKQVTHKSRRPNKATILHIFTCLLQMSLSTNLPSLLSSESFTLLAFYPLYHQQACDTTPHLKNKQSLSRCCIILPTLSLSPISPTTLLPARLSFSSSLKFWVWSFITSFFLNPNTIFGLDPSWYSAECNTSFSKLSSKTAWAASTSFTASLQVPSIPLSTDIYQVSFQQAGALSYALPHFWGCSGFPLERWPDSPRSRRRRVRGVAEWVWGVERGLTLESEKGRGLGALRRFGPQRLPSRSGCERRSRGWGRGTRLLNLAGDGIRLRRSEKAALQGAAARLCWVWGLGVSGVWPPGPATSSGRVPVWSEGVLAWRWLRRRARGKPLASLSQVRGSGSTRNTEIPQPLRNSKVQSPPVWDFPLPHASLGPQ